MQLYAVKVYSLSARSCQRLPPVSNKCSPLRQWFLRYPSISFKISCGRLRQNTLPWSTSDRSHWVLINIAALLPLTHTLVPAVRGIRHPSWPHVTKLGRHAANSGLGMIIYFGWTRADLSKALNRRRNQIETNYSAHVLCTSEISESRQCHH